jgi:hypothetical protein
MGASVRTKITRFASFGAVQTPSRPRIRADRSRIIFCPGLWLTMALFVALGYALSH